MTDARVSAEFALQSLKASLVMVEDAGALIDMAIEGGHSDALTEGLDILIGAVSDTNEILELMGPPTGMGASVRRGMEPWLPHEMVDALTTAIAIDEVALETLLRTHGNLPVQQEALLVSQIFRLLRLMKERVRETQRTIQERWPGHWGPEHDAMFRKYIRKDLPR